MNYSIILAFSAFFLSMIGTKLFIIRKRKYAAPDIQMMMGKAAPQPVKGAEIAVVFSLIICLLGAEIDYVLIASLFVLAGISLLSGFVKIPLVVELLLQLLCVAFALSIMPTPTFIAALSPLSNKLFAGFMWLWFIHIFSGMGRVDGFASTGMVTLGFAVTMLVILSGAFPTALSTHGLIVAAGGLGFLWWNWAPAQTRPTASSSAPIGFILGYLLLLAASAGYAIPAMILPAYYLADGAVSALSRLLAGEAANPERVQSFALRTVLAGEKPEVLARYVTGINMFLALLAAQALLDPPMALFNLCIAYSMTGVFMLFCAHQIHRAKRNQNI